MADEYPVLQELETKLKLQWIDTNDYLATQRAIIEVTPDHAYLELPRGRKGDKGDPGNAISFQGIVARTSDLPTGLGTSDAAKAWVNTATKALHVWNGDQWFTVNNFAGVDADVQQFTQWFAQIASDSARAQDAAERAEFAAEETIQQVTGDFATKNYVDSQTWAKSEISNANTARTVGAYRTNSDTANLPTNASSPFGSLEVLPAGNASISQRFTTWGSVIETWERNPISGDSEQWVAWRLKPSRAELAEKADTTYVEAELAEKADTTYVEAELAEKADTTYVEAELAEKADKSYVDTGLAEKADKSYVDNATHRIGVSSSDANKYVKLGATGRLFVSTGSITEAGDVTNKYYVDGQLASKADTTYVDSLLADKADTSTVGAALAEKADKSYVDSGLSEKADTTHMDSLLSGKADTTYVKTGLSEIEDNISIFAEAVGKDMAAVQNKTDAIGTHQDDSFTVLDVNNRSALSVNPDGSTTIGSTLIDEAELGFRVLDSANRVAFEITGDGKTIINDLVGTEGGGGAAITELHAFICAGQSNMSGRGDPVDEVLDVENPRLLQFGHNRRVIEPAPAILDMMDSPLGLSPARQFGLRYLQTQPANVAVLLIPAAYGGTGFTYTPTEGRKTWTKGHADTEENGLYERALAQSQDALTAAQQAGYTVELKGLLWHQGEANGSSLPQNMQAYSERLDALIADFRTDLNAPDLPAVVGEMMPEGMRDSIAKRSIGYMHAATPGRVQRTAFAPAPDNTMRHNDFAHFSREGAILLGDSFFDAWPRAVLNVPTGKPRAARNVTAYRVGDQVTVSWSAPMSRTTSYTLEWATSADGTWQEVTRGYPMNLSEVFTATNSPVWVRVTAYEDSTPATPTNPIPALGA